MAVVGSGWMPDGGLVQALPVAVVVMESSGVIVGWNSAAESLYGLGRTRSSDSRRST